ncbi:MAG: hypothetical protein KDB27_21180 [Planctomycetales bacterium]|nr:hypothetical protein [Planctomycetales bacterium]
MKRNVDRIEERVVNASPETTVWRYMRLERFLPLLKNNMYFARPIQFDDRWEGMFPPSYLRQLHSNNETHRDLPLMTEHLAARRNMHRHAHFVSCWHISEFESDAMWRLYGLAPEGIAIKSTVGDLLECFRPHGSGVVQYYDQTADQQTSNIFSGPHDILWKRQDFAWEREYRIWFDDDKMIDAFTKEGNIAVSQVEGEFFPFTDAQQLIKEIVVAPFVSNEQVEILKAVLAQNMRKWMTQLIRSSNTERAWEEYARESK